MKKLMFSALACVAFAFSGFASNEVVNEEKVSNENIVIETDVIKNANSSLETKDEFAIEPCSITINFRNEKGEIIRTKTYPKVNYRPYKNCKEAGEALAKKLEGVVKS